jgi:hypothetical protein
MRHWLGNQRPVNHARRPRICYLHSSKADCTQGDLRDWETVLGGKHCILGLSLWGSMEASTDQSGNSEKEMGSPTWMLGTHSFPLSLLPGVQACGMVWNRRSCLGAWTGKDCSLAWGCIRSQIPVGRQPHKTVVLSAVVPTPGPDTR